MRINNISLLHIALGVKTQIMEAIVSYPQKKEELQAVKAFLKALKIKFEISPYDPEFVAKIKRGDDDILRGNTTKVALDEIWK